MKLNELLNNINQNKLNNVYVFTGDEEYFFEYLVNIFKEKVISDNEDMNYNVYDMNEVPLSDAIADAIELPFFGNHKLTVVKNAYFLTGMNNKSSIKHNVDELIEYLGHPNDSTTLLLLVFNAKLDGRKKVVKKIKQTSKIIELNKLDYHDTQLFIKKMVNKDGFNIEQTAIEELMLRTDYNLFEIKNNLLKIESYLLKRNTINVNDVYKLVPKDFTNSVFDLGNAVVNLQFDEANYLYGQFLLNGEEPIKINALLINQFRLYLQVRALMKENLTRQTIAQKLSVHPYRVKLAIQKNHEFSLKFLLSVYEKLIEFEKRLKSTSDDPKLMFSLFLVDLDRIKNTLS